MKISASVYSDKSRSLAEVIQDLDAHQVDLYHVDCNDNLSVFNDIETIKKLSNIPVDLHIISEEPQKYFSYLEVAKVEFVAFQYEQLPSDFKFPKIKGTKMGLAITTPTNIDVFDKYQELDFILIMATIPGQSGGVFDALNFKKIRQFRKRYPQKSIHVDGGVNAEVSFILRNMGVNASVSGSYLFNEKSIGNALMNLTKRNISSHYKIEDFMVPISEAPSIDISDLNFESVLKTIEKGDVGFCMILNNKKLEGIISNADVRKTLLKNINDLSQMKMEDMINRNPLTCNKSKTVIDLLESIKHANFTVMYLPIVDENNNAEGMLTFTNLIKGEL